MHLTNLELADQVRDAVGGLGTEDCLSALHHRGQGAAADAEDLFHRIEAVGAGIVAPADLQVVAEGVVDPFGTLDVTSRAVANTDEILAYGAVSKLRIKRRDARDLGKRDLALLGHAPQGLDGQIAVMPLQDLQDGQNPVRLATHTVEGLIDEGEIEFHRHALSGLGANGRTESILDNGNASVKLRGISSGVAPSRTLAKNRLNHSFGHIALSHPGRPLLDCCGPQEKLRNRT